MDITKGEQKRRLAEGGRDPLTQWKISPLDQVAVEHWDAYSQARNQMFARPHTTFAPWTIVRADDKHEARINVIKDLLAGVGQNGPHQFVEKSTPYPFLTRRPNNSMQLTALRAAADADVMPPPSGRRE